MSAGKLLCIDHGLKRVGIAISDDERDFVWPREVVSLEKSHAEIRRIIDEEEIVGIVVGLPLMLDGSEGEQCREVRKFVAEIQSYSSLDIFLADERMSTKVARSLYGIDNDSLVAVNMLENFIRSTRANCM